MKIKINKKAIGTIGGLLFAAGMAIFDEISNIMQEKQLDDQDRKIKELEEKVSRLEKKEES